MPLVGPLPAPRFSRGILALDSSNKRKALIIYRYPGFIEAEGIVTSRNKRLLRDVGEGGRGDENELLELHTINFKVVLNAQVKSNKL
jgi:hypothetical protein